MPTETKYHKGTRIDLLRCLPKDAIAAELGVFRGDFSAEILSHASPKTLYLVDIYAGAMWSGDRNGEDRTCIDMEKEMANVAARFKDDWHVRVVKAWSWIWLNSLPEHSIDWVYIDTDHTLETTRKELTAAFHAIKPGGFICGHDYDSAWFAGVVQSVNEFADQHRLPLDLWQGDKLWSYQIRV